MKTTLLDHLSLGPYKESVTSVHKASVQEAYLKHFKCIRSVNNMHNYHNIGHEPAVVSLVNQPYMSGHTCTAGRNVGLRNAPL